MTKQDELKIIGKALDAAHSEKIEASFHYFGISGLQVIVRALPLEAGELGEELAKFNFNTRKPFEAQYYRSYEQFIDSLLEESE